MSTAQRSLVSSLVSAGYTTAVRARNWVHDRGWRPVKKLPRPVYSVGNLAMGGTGKTPFIEELARVLSDEGFLTCILSRGHAGRRDRDPLVVSDLIRIQAGPAEAGDEPFMLARKLPGVPVVVGADRHEAGLLALRTFPVHVFLLDDGFQHRRLHRDADFVLLDAVSPWDGLRREGPSGLKRARAVFVTRAQHAAEKQLASIRERVAKVAPSVPVLTTRTAPSALKRLPTGPRRPHSELAGRRILAFAGIAQPDTFFAELQELGAELGRARRFPDHHPYSARDVRRLLHEADEAGASAIVTTEKDSVRLHLPPRTTVPVFALGTRLVFDDRTAFIRVMSQVLPEPHHPGR